MPCGGRTSAQPPGQCLILLQGGCGMKRIFVVLLLCLALLAGCATHYQIMLKDGKQLKAANKPILDPKTGYYTYVDEDGKKVLLKEADVLLIKEK
jgi:hypothetical protein